MRIDIRSETRITRQVRASIDRRVRFALGPLARLVNRVNVRLSRLHSNGTARDHCKIVAHLALRGVVEVEDVDAELQTVIDHVTARIGRAVLREVQRRKQQKETGAGEQGAGVRKQ
jgi:ribosome-associated translation inhibitor RaiA